MRFLLSRARSIASVVHKRGYLCCHAPEISAAQECASEAPKDYGYAIETVSVRYGNGVLREIGAEVRAAGFGTLLIASVLIIYSLSRVALITDATIRSLVSFETVVKSLQSHNIDYVVYDEVTIEPTDQSFLACAQFAQESKVDGFISLGGGSVIDTTKVHIN